MENKQKNNISKIQIYHVIRPKHPILRTFPCHSSQKDAKYPKILADWRIKHNFAFASRRNATIFRENKATKAA